MAKKVSKKELKKWVCKEGCKPSTLPCIHLEKLLPNPNKGAFPLHNLGGKKGSQYNIRRELQQEYRDTLESNKSIPQFEAKIRRLEKRLEKFGLEDFRVELIIDRYISGLSLKEIATRCGYVSASAVQYLIKTTLETIRSVDKTVVRKLWGDYE